jgi:hypothetical protein
VTYNDDDYPPADRAHDAISSIVGMTAKEIAARADVPLSVVQKVLQRNEYFLEQVGRRYRFDNAMDWVELDKSRPLPPLNVGHSVVFVGGSRGYEIEFPEPKPQIQEPVKAAKSRPPLGQSHLFP